VLRTAGLCGGVKVVLEHASRLCARGHNAVIYCLDADTAWFEREVPVRAFGDIAILKQALVQFRGIKVATWHETAPWVAESLQPGDRGYYLVQDIEESYSRSPQEAAEVLQTYSLGLKPLTEGTWVRDQLKERFQLDSVFVSIGLDLHMFQPRPATRDPNLILTQARTWSGGGAAGRRLKGWDTARTTVLRCRLLNPRTSLMTFSMEERPSFPPDLAHVHFRLPNDERLAHLYSRAGLYLLTSTHEGFGLTAAEAMACGCPVVATRADGNEEFCIDGVTALLAPAGDVEQLTQQCLRLQSDPQLASELGQNGRRFILNYTWERVVDRLEQEFLQRPGPEIVIETPKEAGSVPVTVAVDSEYPDLQLDEPPAVDWSIVIPTVNDAEMVARCITSCREHAGENASLEFIVVDDGTRDREVRESLRRLSHEMDFRLLFNHQNLGFSATVNHGMRHARGRFVMLCNNDVLFFQQWRDGLTHFFDDPQLGIAGVRLLYPNRTIQHAGMDKVPGQLRFHHTYGHQPGDHTAAVCNRFVWCVTGALFVIRRETLQQLGGFSSAYGTAWEDVDYCLHAWSHGVRVGYCGEVAAFHLEGGTRGATPAQKSARPLLWAERERSGSVYFNRKWEAVRHVESFEALLPASKRAQMANANGCVAGLELAAR
jgi:GT2 family glycosyltransferase/glycosyltransferase involved in cell wall biosynthesis